LPVTEAREEFKPFTDSAKHLVLTE